MSFCHFAKGSKIVPNILVIRVSFVVFIFHLFFFLFIFPFFDKFFIFSHSFSFTVCRKAKSTIRQICFPDLNSLLFSKFQSSLLIQFSWAGSNFFLYHLFTLSIFIFILIILLHFNFHSATFIIIIIFFMICLLFHIIIDFFHLSSVLTFFYSHYLLLLMEKYQLFFQDKK